jgi:hypothetical protein
MSEKRFLDKTGVGILWDAIKKYFRTNTSIIPVECGGTGASDKENALINLGAVPTSRKINNKYLNDDISLSASDVGAVPTTRKINN